MISFTIMTTTSLINSQSEFSFQRDLNRWDPTAKVTTQSISNPISCNSTSQSIQLWIKIINRRSLRPQSTPRIPRSTKRFKKSFSKKIIQRTTCPEMIGQTKLAVTALVLPMLRKFSRMLKLSGNLNSNMGPMPCRKS